MLSRNIFRTIQSMNVFQPKNVNIIQRSYHMSNKSLGVLDDVSRWLGKIGRKTNLGAATALFNCCQVQAGNASWQSRGLVGSDFRSKHMMLVLHVWMVHKRLLREDKQGLLVQEALFDELWEDTSNRIRGQGINELSINKYLKEVQGYSFRACVELDKAIESTLIDDVMSNPDSDEIKVAKVEPKNPEDIEFSHIEDKILDEIGGVLWRSIYLRKEDIAVSHVLELAKYVRREQLSLLELPREAIFEGRIKWGKVPAWNKTAAKGKEVGDTDNLWREATAPDGRTYYWNTATRESRWEKPVASTSS